MILSLDYLNRIRERLVPNGDWIVTPLTEFSVLHALRVELKTSYGITFRHDCEGLQFVRGAVSFVEAGLMQITYARFTNKDVFPCSMDASMWVVDPLADGWVPLIHWNAGCFSKLYPLEMQFELRSDKPATLDLFLLAEHVEPRVHQ